MNITIVAPYCSLPSEPHFNRFWYLAELLSQSHDVMLITSKFQTTTTNLSDDLKMPNLLRKVA